MSACTRRSPTRAIHGPSRSPSPPAGCSARRTAGRAGRPPTPGCRRCSCPTRPGVRAVCPQDRTGCGSPGPAVSAKPRVRAPQRRRRRALGGPRRGSALHVRFRRRRTPAARRHRLRPPDRSRHRPGARGHRCRVLRTTDAGKSREPLVAGLPRADPYGTVLRDALCTDDADRPGCPSATATARCTPRRTTVTAGSSRPRTCRGRAPAGRPVRPRGGDGVRPAARAGAVRVPRLVRAPGHRTRGYRHRGHGPGVPTPGTPHDSARRPRPCTANHHPVIRTGHRPRSIGRDRSLCGHRLITSPVAAVG